MGSTNHNPMTYRSPRKINSSNCSVPSRHHSGLSENQRNRKSFGDQNPWFRYVSDVSSRFSVDFPDFPIPSPTCSPRAIKAEDITSSSAATHWAHEMLRLSQVTWEPHSWSCWSCWSWETHGINRTKCGKRKLKTCKWVYESMKIHEIWTWTYLKTQVETDCIGNIAIILEDGRR